MLKVWPSSSLQAGSTLQSPPSPPELARASVSPPASLVTPWLQRPSSAPATEPSLVTRSWLRATGPGRLTAKPGLQATRPALAPRPAVPVALTVLLMARVALHPGSQQRPRAEAQAAEPRPACERIPAATASGRKPSNWRVSRVNLVR
jgi:hypothetical protein